VNFLAKESLLGMPTKNAGFLSERKTPARVVT
jgi:hypothetical protein